GGETLVDELEQPEERQVDGRNVGVARSRERRAGCRGSLVAARRRALLGGARDPGRESGVGGRTGADNFPVPGIEPGLARRGGGRGGRGGAHRLRGSSALRSNVRLRLANARRRFADVRARLVIVCARLASVPARLADVGTRLASARARLTNSCARLGNI